MEPEININHFHSDKKKNILIAVIILLVLALGVFYAQKMGWIFKKPPISVYDEINKFRGFIKQKDYDACVAEAQKQIKDDAKNVSAWQWKGVCEFEAGKHEEAKVSFNQVLALDPENKVAKNYLELMSKGVTLINLSKDGISREAFEKLSLIQFPATFDFSYAYPVNQGRVIVTTGQYTAKLPGKQAQVELEKSLKSAKLSFTSQNVNAKGIKSYEASTKEASYQISINILSTPVTIAINITPIK